MAKGISVRVSTKKVIEALSNRLNEIDNDIASYKTAKEVYEKACEDWSVQAVKVILSKKSSIKGFSARTSSGNSYHVSFNFSADLPEKPDSPGFINESYLKNQRDEIEQVLRVLKMTDEETVNASTYRNIVQYL